MLNGGNAERQSWEVCVKATGERAPGRPAGHPRLWRRGGRRRLVIVGAGCLALALIVIAVVQFVSFQGRPLLVDDFNQPNGLITNEFAYHNQGNPAARTSPVWIATSGSLFALDHAGWTGVPDVGVPGPRSVVANNSSVFRLVTRRADFQNVAVSFGLFVKRFITPQSGADVSWRGVHVFLRYQNPDLLYVVSVDRWDGRIVIKKKVPGGQSAGGTYYTLGTADGTAVSGQWEQVKVSATNSGANVNLSVWLDGRLRLRTVDDGVGDVAPIAQGGRVGLRGDYTEFMFRPFTVTNS
jgi:hypothetical protein